MSIIHKQNLHPNIRLLSVTKILRSVTVYLVCFLLVFSTSFIAYPEKSKAYVSTFQYPLSPYDVSAPYGDFEYERSTDRYHLGIDIVRPAGTKIRAMAAGTVKHVGIHARFGTVVLIEHQLKHEKVVSLYGHLRASDIPVREGHKVSRGQYIGCLGAENENGGWVPHLHFGIRKGGYVPIERGWVYWGIGRASEIPKWYHPTNFFSGKIKSNNLPENNSTPPQIITGPGPTGSSHVRFLNNQGQNVSRLDFLSSRGSRGGVDVAVGDVAGDSRKEIITGSGPGNAPIVKVFRTSDGQKISEFRPFASNFRGGVRVSTANMDGKGKSGILVAPREGGGAQLRIFTWNGRSVEKQPLFPFGKNIRTGLDVAGGDLNNDGKDEVVVSTGPGWEPRVRIYGYKQNLLKTNFVAYPIQFRGGVRVTTGDIDNDGEDEIITGAGPGGGPHLRIFESNGKAHNNVFFPFHRNFRGGIDVATTNYDNTGKDEIIVTQTSGGQSWLKVYRYNKARTILDEYIIYSPSFYGGANVAGY